MQIYLNGQIMEAGQAKVPVMDRSYLFGEGIFETFRTYDGVIPFFDKHMARMEWSACFLGMPFAHPREIKDGIDVLLTANQLKDARVKALLSGVTGSFSPVLGNDDMTMNLAIFAEKFVPWPDEDYEGGVGLAVLRAVRATPAPAAQIKSTSWMPKLVGRREILEKDAFDGIFLSPSGHVTETTTANIFWVNGERLFTAPVAEGLLPGITRQLVIDLARENGVMFQEKLAGEEELKAASEVFITNSLIGILPVSLIDEIEVGEGQGKITRLLSDLYSQRLKEEIKELKES